MHEGGLKCKDKHQGTGKGNSNKTDEVDNLEFEVKALISRNFKNRSTPTWLALLFSMLYVRVLMNN